MGPRSVWRPDVGVVRLERESRLLKPPPGSTDPERFATVSIGIGDRVLFHTAPRVSPPSLAEPCTLVSHRTLALLHSGEAFGVRTTWGWVQ